MDRIRRPNLDLTGIHWVIVGGESGPGARPLREEWVLEIREQCQAARVPFFFTQYWKGEYGMPCRRWRVREMRTVHSFHPTDLPGDSAQKTALLINPPVYDTQYWAEWSQPYGLLRIARLLGNLGYKRRELFDFMEAPGEKRKVAQRRIAPGESFIEKDTPDPKSPPYRIEKAGQTLELWKYHFGKS